MERIGLLAEMRMGVGCGLADTGFSFTGITGKRDIWYIYRLWTFIHRQKQLGQHQKIQKYIFYIVESVVWLDCNHSTKSEIAELKRTTKASQNERSIVKSIIYIEGLAPLVSSWSPYTGQFEHMWMGQYDPHCIKITTFVHNNKFKQTKLNSTDVYKP